MTQVKTTRENSKVYQTDVSEESIESHKRIDRIALRLFGDTVRDNRESLEPYIRTMRKARFGRRYDKWVSKILLAALVAFTSVIILVSVSAIIIYDIVLPNPVEAFPFLTVLIPQYLINFARSIATVAHSVHPSFYLVGSFFVLTFLLTVVPSLIMYYIPWYLATERKREVEGMLPYATTYMYSLSRGGVTLLDIFWTLSDSKDIYGSAAEEFGAVVREVELFNESLQSSLRNVSNISESERFKEIADELISVTYTGGDISTFLEDQSEKFLEERKRIQENKMEQLGLLAQIYIVLAVALPLFAIVIVTFMTIIQNSGVGLLFVLVYGLFPLLGVIFGALFSSIQDTAVTSSKIEVESNRPELETVKQLEDEEGLLDTYINYRKREKWKQRLNSPLKALRQEPILTFLITIPIAIAFIGISVLLGFQHPMQITTQPTFTTLIYIIIPYMIVFIPYTILYELQYRKRRKVITQIPSLLRQLASANAQGLTLNQSFGEVAKNTESALGDELSKVQNEINWFNNIEEALKNFAVEINSPRLSRTVNIINKANNAAGDIRGVLEITAQDIKDSVQLERNKRSELKMYAGVIGMSLLIFLLIVSVLKVAFLEQLASAASQQTGAGAAAGGSSSAIGLSSINVSLYKLLFYHGALAQSLVAGTLIGIMINNNPRNGLKYTIGFMLLSTIPFLFI